MALFCLGWLVVTCLLNLTSSNMLALLRDDSNNSSPFILQPSEEIPSSLILKTGKSLYQPFPGCFDNHTQTYYFPTSSPLISNNSYSLYSLSINFNQPNEDTLLSVTSFPRTNPTWIQCFSDDLSPKVQSINGTDYPLIALNNNNSTSKHSS